MKSSNLKSCSGCLKTYSLDFLMKKNHVTAVTHVNLSNKNCQVTSRTNQKRRTWLCLLRFFLVIYNTKTENKKEVMYHYLCSQSNELNKKPHKNPDITKQRDRESMVRYNCKERIKILIDETEHAAYVVIKHHNLPVVSVSETIKQFIKDNVDLFPQTIYLQLVANGMDIAIRQKQVHYW